MRLARPPPQLTALPLSSTIVSRADQIGVRIARTPRLVLAHPRHVTRRPAAAAAGVVMTTGQSSGASGPASQKAGHAAS